MKAFIFDMDGVIMDSEPLHNEIIVEMMTLFGLKAEEPYLASLCGLTIDHIFEKIKSDYNLDISVNDTVKKYNGKLVAHVHANQLVPISGIPELLQQLQAANIPAAVASSSPIEFIEASIDNLNLTHYFQFLLSGDEVEHGKPAPDIYLEAAKRLTVTPVDCVVLEDSHNGATAAKSAGMKCIGFKNPGSGIQDLSITDIIVDDVNDIDISIL
ncbi:HAD family hydrolase [Pectinatus brassicae]|uniref:HAD superfamily hydrolase (TIGR01509 family) n=1 Tax=Pectinatus brassicae TaxID=862415 RepID=A0A840UM13_9FIRM|nr:HAD family phosphatase [Pectinatus brassicae]MBB5335728.1 HAD superfamily hydrolase (TIGR01509 family) [Pectinatus brassicae]